MNDEDLVELIKKDGTKAAVIEHYRAHKVSLSESEEKVNALSKTIGINTPKIPKKSDNKLLYSVVIIFLIGSLTYLYYKTQRENKTVRSNVNVESSSPDDQTRFEQEDKLIYNQMCATDNSYKRNELEEQLSKHRASVGLVNDWFFIVSSISQGVLDKDFNYDKSLFTIEVRSENGLACTLYIDANDNSSMQIAKQIDNGEKIIVSGYFSWSGMIAGFTLKNARIKKAD
jgi:hypothetical protein